MAIDQIPAGLGEIASGVEDRKGVLSLQELSRESEGWSLHDVDGWHVHSYRAPDEWRGSGVGFRSECWTLMRKKQSPHGVGVRLRRIRDGAEIWCGSTRISQGASREQHATEMHSFLDVLPATTLPVVFGGDMNTPVRWHAVEGGQAQPFGPEAKGDYMLGLFHSKKLVLTPPKKEHWNSPTSRPRKQEAQGRQIDMVGSKHALPGEAHIHTGSYLWVGGDHDAVSQVISFRYKAARRATKGGNRPRAVVRKPVLKGN